MKLIALVIMFAGIYLIFLRPILLIRKAKKEKLLHFEQEFKKFNQSRYTPLSKDFYQGLYEYTFSNEMLFLSRGEVGGGNQRDGDELMTNSDRNPIERIADHHNFDRMKKGSTIIHGLGYTFTKKANFELFVKTFLTTMPVGTICFPINKTWAVFIKRDDGKVNFSYDQSILTNKDYLYLIMS